MRAAGSAWNTGDFDHLLALLDPEFEYSPELDDAGRPLFPGLKPLYRGPEETGRHWREWRSVFEGDVHAELIGAAYGTDCCAVLLRMRAEARSGLTTEREIASAINLRDGRIRRWRNYPRWRDALDALGLPPDRDPVPV